MVKTKVMPVEGAKRPAAPEVALLLFESGVAFDDVALLPDDDDACLSLLLLLPLLDDELEAAA